MSGQLCLRSVLRGQLRLCGVLRGQLCIHGVMSGQLCLHGIISGQLCLRGVMSGQLRLRIILHGHLCLRGTLICEKSSFSSNGIPQSYEEGAANINKSLSTLGMDSLGGNSKTTIMADISPSTCSVYETLSTLISRTTWQAYSDNAKINEDASVDVIALQRQIQQLKDQLSFLMKHQHASLDLPDFSQDSEKSSLGYFPGRFVTFYETNLYGEHKIPRGGHRMMKNLEDTLTGVLHQKKLTEMEVKRLRAEIERMNLLVH
ncbi:phragmoplast orienting kinesin-1 [Dorcoceras hygrometricum]|uniref:Phragmoplast orienting kinesin-1 n=1 Tax=Dorcoceras hygrometricum TaxID=472368 RepID=A0A2Z7AHY8_9LAMI|nr:phragmoplast orienting kinesin-1 [Dorcoceras hygrometricum]